MTHNILCKLGIHRPLKNHRYAFTDKVTDLSVYHAECDCGKKWFVDSPLGYFGFKVSVEQYHNGTDI